MDYLPVKNSLQAFWHRDIHPLSEQRSTPSLPERSDIVIIGAGYAGVATAYHLLKELENEVEGAALPAITLVEARGVCSGATGRNGGHLRPDLYGNIPRYMDRAGVQAGAELAEFEVANMYAIKKAIEEEGIQCDFTMTRSIEVWCDEESALKARKANALMASRNLEYMRDVFFTSGPAAEGYSGIKGAQAAASFTAGTMWPYKFILNLLGPMVESGKINLQTQTPITSITNDGHKQNPACKYSVHTSRGTILAKQIICASNAYVAGLLPEYEKNIIPCKGICCHIATPEGKGPHSAPLLTNSYIHHTPDGDLSYLIPRTDGSIIVGGASKSFFPYKEQWYKNVDDSRLIDAAKDYYEGYMQRTFHGWEDSGADVTKIWTGVMGYSFDSHPHIGRVPDKEGQYIAAGFNGHGMPVIWLATKGLVAMVVSDMRRTSGAADVPRKEFKDIGLPRLYETTKERIRRAQTAKEEDGDIIGIGAAFAKDATLEINSTEGTGSS